MKKQNKNFIWMAAVTTLFLFTAGWKQPSQLSLTQPHPISFATQDVTLSARIYTPEDSKEHLHRDLIDRGYIPVEVTVYNNTGKSYAISGASTPLACGTPQEIAWSVTKRSIPRSIAYKIVGFFFWPMAIPGTIDSVRSFKNHRDLVKDLTAKTLKVEEEIIPPYAAVKRVLYVKKEGMRKEFSFSLQDIEGKDLKVIPLRIT